MEFRNLVFEGGGVWGIAYEGALAELEAQGAIDFAALQRVAGASAGAITACLLAVGYRPRELGDILRDTDFSEFMDDDLGFARDTARLLKDYGWYKGDKFRRWLRALIASKIAALSEAHGIKKFARNPTFRELAAWQRSLAGKGHALPALYIVGSNLSQQRREVYSAERSHSPDLKASDAVRRSMSIPLFFTAARGENRDVIVDGGLTWNYPLNLFDDRKYLHDPASGLPVSYAPGKRFVFNRETLGFRVDTAQELQLNLKDWANEPMQVDSIIKYGWALVAFMRAVANKQHLHQNDWSRTVFIDVGNKIGFTDFELSSKDQDFLSERGSAGVTHYLKWLRSARGKREVASIYKRMAGED